MLRRAHLILTLFIVFQIADGLITYAAVDIFGVLAEGNPLLRTWMLIAGAGPALVGAKLLACSGSLLLFVSGWHRSLAGLSLVYCFGAVVPWLVRLSTAVS
jgi:hypothetical protein